MNETININGVDYEPVAERVKGKRPVLVTTDWRGVFFGYTDVTAGPTITLRNARNCIFWHKSIGGFGGLATVGPNDQCRIGAQISEIELRGVTSVSEVSEQAARAWNSAPCVA